MPKRGDCKECKTGSKYGWCDKCTDTVVKMFVTEAIPFFHTSALNLISCTNTFNKNSTGAKLAQSFFQIKSIFIWKTLCTMIWTLQVKHMESH